MRSSKRLSMLCLSLLALSAIGHAVASPASTPEVAAREYLAAEKAFDVAALESVITPGFVEISPRGEIDEHDKVLSFYTPEQKVEALAIELGEFHTRTSGDTAIVTTTLSYVMPGRSMTLTVGMAAIHTPDRNQGQSRLY
jgi:hypothetical protein